MNITQQCLALHSLMQSKPVICNCDSDFKVVFIKCLEIVECSETYNKFIKKIKFLVEVWPVLPGLTKMEIRFCTFTDIFLSIDALFN